MERRANGEKPFHVNVRHGARFLPPLPIDILAKTAHKRVGQEIASSPQGDVIKADVYVIPKSSKGY